MIYIDITHAVHRSVIGSDIACAMYRDPHLLGCTSASELVIPLGHEVCEDVGPLAVVDLEAARDNRGDEAHHVAQTGQVCSGYL